MSPTTLQSIASNASRWAAGGRFSPWYTRSSTSPIHPSHPCLAQAASNHIIATASERMEGLTTAVERVEAELSALRHERLRGGASA